MLFFPVFHLPVTAALAGVLFASLWQGSLLVLLVAAGLRLLPRLTAAARAAIWAAVLLVIAVHPLLTFFRSGAAAGGARSAGLVHAEFGLSVALVAAWAVASLFRFFQLLISAAEVWRTLRRAQPLGSPAAVSTLLRESKRKPQLCSSALVSRPCVVGFLRPRLLMPADLLPALSEAELTQIVLHELEHLRRGDDWVNLLQQVALVLLPLHPGMLWVSRQVALERELACDDAVLATTRAGKAYAACLAHVAERSLVRRGLSLAVGALGSRGRRSELTARVERILRRPERTLSGMPLRLATGLVLAGTVVTGGALAHSPTLVSFGPETTAVMAEGSAAGGRFALAGLKPALAGFAVGGGATGVRGTSPRVVLLKAVMPGAGAASDAKDSSERLRPAVVRRARRAGIVRAGLRRRGRIAASPWLVLTSWEAGPSKRAVGLAYRSAPRMVPAGYAPRLRPVVVETQQVWYTAVRAFATPDGWLVVQL